MIERRLSKHSSKVNSFKSVKKEYSNALKLSGYKQELKYRKKESKNILKRRRKCIWFDQPFCRCVRTKTKNKTVQ